MTRSSKLKNICESSLKVIEATIYDSPHDKGEKIYTHHDEHGNYPLANDGSVFFTSKDHLSKMSLDGKPSSHNPKYYVFKINNHLGIWDDNLHLVAGPFHNWKKLIEFLLDKPVMKKKFDDFSITYDDLIDNDIDLDSYEDDLDHWLGA